MPVKKWLFLLLLFLPATSKAVINLSGTWSEAGDYKMSQQDQYPGGASSNTISALWDGNTIHLFGGRGEQLYWVTYLLGGASDAINVMVSISSFTGTGAASGHGFAAVAVSSSNVWDYTQRPYSLYKYGYVQLLGKDHSTGGAAWDLSEYDEQQFPARMQVPYTVNGSNQGVPNTPVLWTNRQIANKFIPDPAVPIEEFGISSFTVAHSSSQAIGGELYIATDTVAGTYISTITVYENSVTVSTQIPVILTVNNFIMSATPSIPVMAVLGYSDIDVRLYGTRSPANDQVDPYLTGHLRATAFLHRHKVMVQGDPFISGAYYPSTDYLKHQDGSAFKEAYGLAYNTSLGYGAPDTTYWMNVYGNATNHAISTFTLTGATGYCTYVSSELAYCQNHGLGCQMYTADDEASQSVLHTKDNILASYNNVYSTCQVNGSTLPYLQTGSLQTTASTAPYINTIVSTEWLNASSTTYQALQTLYLTQSSHSAAGYNSNLGVDSLFASEEEGLGPREVMWGAWKTKMPFWFLWEINYWSDGNNCPQTNNGFNALGSNCDNDNFNIMKDFGYDVFPSTDAAMGHTGFNFSNKDGLMIYPGTDSLNNPSYGFNGVIGSWRLNQLTRGIQDADLLTRAYVVNPSSTAALVNTMVQDVMYYRPCFNSSDCSYSYGPRPWNQTLTPTDQWERARQSLENIIVSGPPPPTPSESWTGTITIKGTVTLQ